ncbi:MAG TPA: polysulfide reductase NrfD, partial [Flavobacteriales bacterium]|nr:polysulfide reductase NrfD [Flavobacteriales bacterium]
PLLWDVFAVSTYGTVSLLFWYMGMIPDLATLRDRADARLRLNADGPRLLPFVPVRVDTLRAYIYGFLALGWRFSSRHWHRYEKAYLMLAGVSTPLVLSVHSIVSFDFATSVIPGWHTTIFPPYFVSGAVFSGFAMVQTLLLVMRKVMKLESYITIKHIEYMNIVIIVTGSIVGVAYITELFISWYSGVEYESYAFINRATGPYWWSYWAMMTCNVVSPQVFWFKKLRTNLTFTFFMSIVVNIGMWFERFVIIVTSLHRDYLPSAWNLFHPTWVDVGIFVGTLGIFFTLYLLFARFFPVLALNELKSILKLSGESYKQQAQHHHH